MLLIVNTASKCGFTPQHDGLEAIHRELEKRGLVVLGSPCNHGGQSEAATERRIEAAVEKHGSIIAAMRAGAI